MARGNWRNWDNQEKKGRAERKPNELTTCKTCGKRMARKDLAEHIRTACKEEQERNDELKAQYTRQIAYNARNLPRWD